MADFSEAEEGDEDEEEEDTDADSIGSLDWNRAEDSKSHFTEYSMTSSVIKRNEGILYYYIVSKFSI